jgi:predicted nucleic acid-binding Zn ribbon protein
MLEPKIRFCQLCGELLPNHRNGNSKYCSDECYDINKKNEAVINRKKRALSNLLLWNDNIVHSIYTIEGVDSTMSAKILIDKGFKWEINAGETALNNLRVKKLIRYGYTLFTNQTVKIWKF